MFAVRMAVYAVRTESPSVLRAGLVCIALDDDVVDWRDLMTVLSLIEYCAGRLGLDFRRSVEDILPLATAERGSTIVNGYLSSSPQLRQAAAVRSKPTGEGATFRFGA